MNVMYEIFPLYFLLQTKIMSLDLLLNLKYINASFCFQESCWCPNLIFYFNRHTDPRFCSVVYPLFIHDLYIDINKYKFSQILCKKLAKRCDIQTISTHFNFHARITHNKIYQLELNHFKNWFRNNKYQKFHSS